MSSVHLINGHPFTRYQSPDVSVDEAHQHGQALFDELNQRRSIRSFRDDPVPRSLIECAIRTASTAPSGAHRQPWTFVAISKPGLKRDIRRAAEEEERKNYAGRMPEAWLEAIAPLGTHADKPYLEIAPWLVVVFAQKHSQSEDGGQQKHYYVQESVGIACGIFITALHRMGLATLTHTPSPMGFLSKLLNRPPNETPFILFPVGYPAKESLVPVLQRKSLEDISVFFDRET